MVSRRKFFSIVIMMFVLLFLFQFSMVIRDWQNTYDINSNLTAKQNDGKNVWRNKEVDLKSVTEENRNYLQVHTFQIPVSSFLEVIYHSL